MNQARPSPEAIAQAVSVVPAISVDTTHMTASWRPRRQRRIDELRQEGGEKDDRLGIGQRHRQAAGEMDVVGDGGAGSAALAARARPGRRGRQDRPRPPNA